MVPALSTLTVNVIATGAGPMDGLRHVHVLDVVTNLEVAVALLCFKDQSSLKPPELSLLTSKVL